MNSRVVALAAAVLFGLGIGTLSAQTPAPTPSPAPTATPAIHVPNNLPSVNQVVNDVIQAVAGQVTGAFGYNANEARGTVTYFRRFDMQVQLQLNKYRDVRLHQGTIINPRGWTIQPGQTVTVYGHADPNGVLEADSITVSR